LPQPGPPPERDGHRSSLVAAYESGRLVNRLEWHAQQAWLLPALDLEQARSHARAVRAILSELPPTSHPAIRGEAAPRWEDSCLALRDEWDTLFGSHGHVEEVGGTASLLARELAEDGIVCPDRLREQWWFDALRHAVQFIEKVWASVCGALDERCQTALRLGCWVDRSMPSGA
jgi:hypothetical protein